MPFLRVIRDKRGYETTYLMHWFRDGNRQRSRILYVFRTPGGVRVGRDPLEPAVQRELEARHPEVPFEWKVIRENQQIIEPAVERRRRPKSEEAAASVPQAPASASASAAPSAGSSPGSPLSDAAARPKPIPSTIAGTTADEHIAFLQEWYPLIRERIDQRISDPARRDALRGLAERLNPSAWTDADQIAAGVPQATEALERLSRVFARRRRRGKRRPSDPTPPPPSSEPS